MGVLLLEKILQLSGATVRLQVTILYVQEVLTHFYSNHGSLITWLNDSQICAGKSCNMYYLITINHKFYLVITITHMIGGDFCFGRRIFIHARAWAMPCNKRNMTVTYNIYKMGQDFLDRQYLF